MKPWPNGNALKDSIYFASHEWECTPNAMALLIYFESDISHVWISRHQPIKALKTWFTSTKKMICYYSFMGGESKRSSFNNSIRIALVYEKQNDICSWDLSVKIFSMIQSSILWMKIIGPYKVERLTTLTFLPKF